MDATSVRREAQSNVEKAASETTRYMLSEVMKSTRKDLGGLSIMEVAEVIREEWHPTDVALLKHSI